MQGKICPMFLKITYKLIFMKGYTYYFVGSNNQGDNEIPESIQVPRSAHRWAAGSLMTIHLMRPDGQKSQWSKKTFELGGRSTRNSAINTNIPPRHIDHFPATQIDEFPHRHVDPFPGEFTGEEAPVPRIHIDPMPMNPDQRQFQQLNPPGSIAQNEAIRLNQPVGPRHKVVEATWLSVVESNQRYHNNRQDSSLRLHHIALPFHKVVFKDKIVVFSRTL